MTPDAHYWDQTARNWQANGAHRLWRRHSDAVNTRLLSQWLADIDHNSNERPRLLKTDLFDEAFGNGLVDLLRQRAGAVVGIDVSPQVLAAARAHAPGAWHVAADVRQLPFADHAFDCIVSLSTLDHFQSHDQIETSMRELGRVLRPGGQLLLTLDNAANPIVWLRNVALFPWLHRVGIVPYFVGKTCGPKRLAGIVERAGLHVRDIRAVLHCPRVAAVAVAKGLHHAEPRSQRRFLDALMSFERMSSWPSRFISGYFVAVRAVKE